MLVTTLAIAAPVMLVETATERILIFREGIVSKVVVALLAAVLRNV